MKKILIIFAAASFFINCNNNQETKNETTTETNKKTGDTTVVDNGNTALPPSEIKPSSDDREEGGAWSEADQNLFMRSCVGSASTKVSSERANEYCDCMLETLTHNFSSYAEADRALSADTARMNQMAAACNGR